MLFIALMLQYRLPVVLVLSLSLEVTNRKQEVTHAHKKHRMKLGSDESRLLIDES